MDAACSNLPLGCPLAPEAFFPERRQAAQVRLIGWHARKRLFEVVEQVVGVLNADGKAHEVVLHAQRQPFLSRSS